MKKTILLLIAGFILFVSCTKDNNYPVKFVRKGFYNGDVRLITKSGVVSNSKEITEFTERIRSLIMNGENAPEYIYSFDDDVSFMDGNEIEIVFTSETKGTIRIKSEYLNEYQTTEFNLIKKGDYYIVSLNEVVESYNYIDNPRFKCTPEIIERVPLPLGQEMVKYRKPLYIKRDGDEILVCIASYMESSHFSDNSLRSVSISGAMNNMINEEYFNLIQRSSYNLIDSIAVKEGYIRFK